MNQHKQLHHIIIFISMMLLSTVTSYAHFTTKGPYGGSVTCMLATDTIIYVGTHDGGVYRSINTSASSWKYANYTGLTNGAVRALAAIGNKVIAGTDGGGVFISTDAGNSWMASNSGLSNMRIRSLIFAGDHLLAGTDGGGIFISHDSGSTWQTSNVGLTAGVVLSFAYDGTMIYAGTDAGVFFSADDGDSWTGMNTGLTNVTVHALAVSGADVFAGTSSGVFKWDASASLWGAVNTGLDDTYINGLTISGGLLYALTNAGIYFSANGAVSWDAANTGYADTTIALVSYNNKLYAGTLHDGIYRSNSISTINWVEFNTGFNNLKTYTVYNSGLLVITATNKGVFVSRDLATNYTRANTGLLDSLHINCIVFDGTKLYAGTTYEGVFMSADTGTTWTAINSGLTNMSVKVIGVTGSYVFAACANGEVYSSLVNNINWTINTGIASGSIPTSITTDGSSLAFLGTQNNGVYSNTDGSTWTAANTGLTNTNVTSLVISQSTVFAGTNGGGVFKSNLQNVSWSAINESIPTDSILSLGASGQWVIAGYRGGVHITYDDGNSWHAPNVLMYIPAYADITAISFTPTSTRFFVSTPDNSLYSNGIGELPVGINEIEHRMSAIGVSPNPSNGNFTIDLKETGANASEISVFTVNGQLIDRVIKKSAGTLITIEGEYPSGIYFLHVQTNKGSFFQKILIQ